MNDIVIDGYFVISLYEIVYIISLNMPLFCCTLKVCRTNYGSKRWNTYVEHYNACQVDMAQVG